MALAEKLLAAEFNRPGFNVVDHYTYAFCGDGCLMEGISHEACSLAGTLGLGKLIVFYDDNGISIDGKVRRLVHATTRRRALPPTAGTWSPTSTAWMPARSRRRCARRAPTDKRPSLICCKTIIGFGAPDKQGTKEAHGEALGVEEVAARAQAARLAVPAVRRAG